MVREAVEIQKLGDQNQKDEALNLHSLGKPII